MRMEGHRIAKNLHKQDIPRLSAGTGFFTGCVLEPGDNAAQSAQPVALMELRPQEFRNGKNILPAGDGSQHLIFHPVSVGQHALLMAAWAEVTRLAAEGKHIIMAACVCRNSYYPVRWGSVWRRVQATQSENAGWLSCMEPRPLRAYAGMTGFIVFLRR